MSLCIVWGIGAFILGHALSVDRVLGRQTKRSDHTELTSRQVGKLNAKEQEFKCQTKVQDARNKQHY